MRYWIPWNRSCGYLLADMWVQEIEPVSSGRATSAFFFFFFFFGNRVSLCSPVCSGTQSVDQAGFKLRDLSLPLEY